MSQRVLTVVGQSAYNYKKAPAIRLHGKWLERLGFKIGEKVSVEEEYGRLVICRFKAEDQNEMERGNNGEGIKKAP